MDIEFIEQQHRDNIFKLMEVCGIDMPQAYQLYTNAGNSFEKAMQMHYNQAPHQEPQNYGGHFQQPKSNDHIGETDDFDQLYQKYRAYKQKGTKFQNRYQIRKDAGFFGSLVPKFLKSQPQSNFKKLLQNYFGRSCPVQFSAGSLSSTLAESDKFPVIVYILDFSAAIKPKIQQILRSNQFAEMANVQFKNFGIDPTYDIQKTIQKFVDRKKNNNCLVILRVNAVQQIQVLKTIKLASSTLKQVIQGLKLTKNASISKDLDDGHLERRLQEELMGNFEYQKPMSIAQRRKVAQDRLIRKKQQQQFYASMKVQQQRQRKNSAKNEAQLQTYKSTSQTKPTINKQVNKIEKKQAPKRNITEQRKIIRQKLKTYTTGINIKLRLPNGQSVIIVVDPSQKGKYLYDFVQSLDKDIGFEKDADRTFNIIRPYDKLNLKDQQNRTLNDIFQGSQSQNLVISQI